VHLLSELTGGHEDQAARGAAAVLDLRADAGEQRQAEGERLARAGGGLAEHVTPCEGVGQGGGLDGERAVDAAPLEGGHELLGQAQLTERRTRGGLDGVLFRGGDDVVRLERDRVDHSHAGWGSVYSSERVPWKRRRAAQSRRPHWRSLRPELERRICTDALMPRRSVREDDRPMCRYA
jgi:hypothetical protein